MISSLRVLKGHGTENDFVLIRDLDGELALTAAQVRALCDRRAGVGGDGVLRAVRTARLVGADVDAAVLESVAGTEFFMDYRNADGSVAEMCGNGTRVFVRYLLDAGLVPSGPVRIGTRAGALLVTPELDGQITVDLGPAGWIDAAPVVDVPGWGQIPGTAVSMPNPHVVIEVDSAVRLAALDLSRAPSVMPPLPNGQNVEFVHRLDDHHLRMRVHERGSGETRSCGTGIGAVAAAFARSDAAQSGTAAVPWRVDVPGGTCTVTFGADGSVRLTGPAVIVGAVELDTDWLSAAGFTPTASLLAT